MSKKQDSRPLLAVISMFFIGLGIYFSLVLNSLVYHLFTAIGFVTFVALFLKKKPQEDENATTRKRNLIVGTIIFLLAIVIIWITFENRFDLETMAKTKSI
jgi:NADH:ubiquinone oxidoreductase subunit 6 (subunit J)